jgi:membrane associated rhomboid family serine protease
MGNFLTVLFAIVISLGFLCFFPIRNAVKHRGRPWATWGLIAANVAAWLVPTLDSLFGGQLGLAAWFGQLAFSEDFSRPWTLVTSQFVHAHNPFQLLISLWLLYLIAPVLEEHLKPFGLLALYVGGGASAAALFGALSMKTGAHIYLAGRSPGFIWFSIRLRKSSSSTISSFSRSAAVSGWPRFSWFSLRFWPMAFRARSLG